MLRDDTGDDDAKHEGSIVSAFSTSPKWSRSGFALTTSLVVVIIVGALIAGTVFTTQFESNVALNDAAAAQAQYVAQAGLQKYKAVLFQAFRYNESLGGGTGFQCENSLSNGIDIFRDGAVSSWVNNRIDLGSEQVLNVDGEVIGTFRVALVRDPGNDSRITVVSEGNTAAGQNWRQAQARATSTFIIRNSAGTEQAIFAGTGHGMKFFNGNTEVYGGIHIVGDEASPETVVIDTRGNSRVLNSYTATQAGTTNTFLVDEAQEADNLCASVRVQYGRVVVDGNANFGATNNPLLTVAVGSDPEDLIAGNTDCDDKKMNVCADSVGIFDLWDSAPVFPQLDESPGTELCLTQTWRQCIRDEAEQDGMTLSVLAEGSNTVALTGSLAAQGAVLPSTCQIALNQAAANADNALIFDASEVDCTVDVGGRKYGFRYRSGSFETFGNLDIRGLTFQFERDVVYTAESRGISGTKQNYSALTLESVGSDGGDFIAKGNFVSAASRKFPDNVISVVAERDVKLLGKNGHARTLPAYAGREFLTGANTRLFGQAIADTFCTVSSNAAANVSCTDKGGSPAQIFYVPTGGNRPDSFSAISPTGGVPTFRVEAYELR